MTEPTTPPEPPRQLLTADEFMKIWRGEYRTDENYKKYYQNEPYEVVFENIEVKENIIVKDEKELPHLFISNSTTRNFGISNSSTGDFKIDDTTIRTFYIMNSTIRDFRITHSIIAWDIRIMSSTTRDFRIDGKSILEDVDIFHSTTGNFEIVNSTTRRMSVSKSVTSQLLLTNSKIKNQLLVEKSHLSLLSLQVHNEIAEGIVCENCTIETIEWKQTKPLQVFIQRKSQIGTLQLNNLVFPKDAVLQINDSTLNRVEIESVLSLGYLTFKNVKAASSYLSFKYEKDKNGNKIYAKTDSKQYVTEEIVRDSLFRIANSDLGKAQFINCDLASFQRFEFLNSKILEVFVAGGRMPTQIFTLEGHNEIEQQRLGYAQFKKIFENRGDTVTATEYLAKELETYRKELRKKSKLSTKEWFDVKGEQFTLWLNQVSSYYGNNWLRAFVVTVGITLTCFGLYCWLLGYRLGTNGNTFGNLLSYAPEFINPLRKDLQESINKYSPTGDSWPALARVWDYFSRIVVAYFAYQTIQAFRKFGKKGGA